VSTWTGFFAVADRVQWQTHVKTKVNYEFLVRRKIPLLAYWLHASQVQLRVSGWLQCNILFKVLTEATKYYMDPTVRNVFCLTFIILVPIHISLHVPIS